MRKFLFLCGTVGLVATLSPTVLCAQFQAPNPDELKMTSDPKAPGAAAVYLDYEETDNDGMHSQIYYARIKVLTEKGKGAATVQIPYRGGEFSIGSVSGRTIHSDGTIVPLTVKPEDLLIQKYEVGVGHETDGGQVREQRTVFTLPSAEVGCILEYSYQLRFNAQFYWHLDPDWQVQQRYFVHKAHYLFTPTVMLNLLWWPNLPQSAQVITDAAGRYILDVKDIPAAPDEEWMPPTDSVLYKVHFYYRGPADSMDVNDYWKDEAKDWSKDVDHFAEPTKPIRDAVAGLVAPGDSDLVKAQKLYAAVEALDNTDYSRQVGTTELKQLNQKEATRAEDIWAQKRGNSNDLAQLYLSLLRAAGLTAYATKVVDRDRGNFDASYMSLDQLDNTLVILNTGGKDVLLDPGEKMCPFGTVDWRHSDAGGLRQSADGPGRAVTPAQVF